MNKKGMNLKSLRAQAGVSLFGAVIIMVLLACIALVVAKTVPSVTEYRSVVRLIQKCSSEGKTVADARDIFDRNAYVYDISSISSKDLEVERTGEGVSVSVDYTKMIPLAGPVSLAIEYKANSERGS